MYVFNSNTWYRVYFERKRKHVPTTDVKRDLTVIFDNFGTNSVTNVFNNAVSKSLGAVATLAMFS